MRKPVFLYQNKGTDQLHGNPVADQHLCFHYIDSTIPSTSLVGNVKPLAIFYGCTARFVLNLLGNPEDRFFWHAAPICTCFRCFFKLIEDKHTVAFSLIIPPANCVCGRVYCFHVVRPNERTNESVSVTFCFLNILESL